MRSAMALVSLFLVSVPALAAPSGSQQSASSGTPNYCLQVEDLSARGLCAKSRLRFYSGDYTGARAAMTSALQASPREGIIRALLARILMRQNDPFGAERELRQARKDGAADFVVLPVLFRAMVEQKEESGLLKEFPDPGPTAKGDVDASILAGRALALLSLKRTDEAAAAMDRSLTIRRDTDGLLLRARIANEHNESALATRLIDEAYVREPTSPAVLGAKLGELQRSGNDTATLALAGDLLRVNPISADARLARIKIYLRQRQDAKAQVDVNALLARTPRLEEGLYYKAVLMSHAGDKKGAALTIDPLPKHFVTLRPEYAAQMADIFMDNGNREAAGSVMESALLADPRLLEVRLKLASLRLSQNSPRAALTVLQPVETSSDSRVQKLRAEARSQLAKHPS